MRLYHFLFLRNLSKPKKLWEGNISNTTISLPELKNYTVILCSVRAYALETCVVCKNSDNFGFGDDIGDNNRVEATIKFDDSQLIIKTIRKDHKIPTLNEVWGII